MTCLSQTLPGVTTEATPLSKSREVSPEMEGLESDAVFHKEKLCVVEVRTEPFVVQLAVEVWSTYSYPHCMGAINQIYVTDDLAGYVIISYS